MNICFHGIETYLSNLNWLIKIIQEVQTKAMEKTWPSPHNEGICMSQEVVEMSHIVCIAMESELEGDILDSLPADICLRSHSWRLTAASIAWHSGAQ